METSLPKRKKDTHPRFNILYFTEVLKEAETCFSNRLDLIKVSLG